MFSAKIVADSLSPLGVRVTTFQLEYPRIILAEVNTHRMFSRSSASSRAIPVEKMIEQVRNNPALPVHWGKNQRGMQAREEVDDVVAAKKLWLKAANNAADVAEEMEKLGLHKQVSNRIMEAYQWTHTIVTATEWDNFWELRCHEDADPNFQKLAWLIKENYDASTPRRLEYGQWHLPYISLEEEEQYGILDCVKCSVARSARVSFRNHDGSSPDPAKDIDLHDKLVVQKPAHASPAEHQATPLPNTDFSKNFRGWEQYRTQLENQQGKNN